MRTLLIAGLAATLAVNMARAEPAETTGSVPRPEGHSSQTRAGSIAYLNQAERAKLRTTALNDRAPRVAKDKFPLDIGSVVPATVKPRAVSRALSEVHPGLRGYSYFMMGDEIVIVEPGTSRIVAIIPV